MRGGMEPEAATRRGKLTFYDCWSAKNRPQPSIRRSSPSPFFETVIDDSTPQLLAYVSELLLAAGAWDVYRIPVQMKKGRTGVQMTVLSSPSFCPHCAN